MADHTLSRRLGDSGELDVLGGGREHLHQAPSIWWAFSSRGGLIGLGLAGAYRLSLEA